MVPEGTVPCSWMFKNCFLSKLPQHLRAVCRSKEFSTLMQMALAADEIMDINSPRSLPTSSWSAAAVTSSDQLSMGSKAETGFQPVMASFNGRGWQLRFYHARFGRDAQKCNSPCNWPTSEAPSNQNSSNSNPSGNLSRAGRK